MTTAQLELAKTEMAATENIAQWWRDADVLPHFPMSTDTAIQLLRGQESSIDEDVAHRYIDQGRIQSPLRKSGRLTWYAIDVLLLRGALEFNRAWQPMSKLHDWKKSNFSLSLEQAQAAGRSPESVFEDLADFSIDDLLLLMVRADDRVARECFYESIKIKMEKA